MRNLVLILSCLLLIQQIWIIPSAAETLYFEGFDQNSAMNLFDINMAIGVSASISNEKVFEGNASLHLLSTSSTEYLSLILPLNIPFTSDLVISMKQYLVEGFPYFQIMLEGITNSNSAEFLVLEFTGYKYMESNNSGPEWVPAWPGGAYGEDFQLKFDEWYSIEFDLIGTLDILFNNTQKPWDYFIPRQLEGINFGLYPTNEFDERNVFIDNFEVFIIDQSSVIDDQQSNKTELSFAIPSFRDFMPVGILFVAIIIIITIYQMRKNNS